MRLQVIAIITLCFSMKAFCQNEKAIKPGATKPFVLGVIDEIQSAVLHEKRVLNIYLPDGYNEKDTVKYPVIYLLDGSADEDFIHIAGIVQFNSFPWINGIPKSILVGIANTDRRRDFTFPSTVESEKKQFPTTGKSADFIAFIEKELQPFIEAKYKGGSSKTVIGESLGGLLATEILFKKPTLFDKYIIISPSLWWDGGSLLNQSFTFPEQLLQKTDVYIGVGKEGLTPTNPARVMEVDVNLLAEKLRKLKNKNLNIYFDYLPQEDHATIGHQAVFNAFRMIYPDTRNK